MANNWKEMIGRKNSRHQFTGSLAVPLRHVAKRSSKSIVIDPVQAIKLAEDPKFKEKKTNIFKYLKHSIAGR